MYVVVQHTFLNPPEAFSRGGKLIKNQGAPDGTTGLQFYPARDGAGATCCGSRTASPTCSGTSTTRSVTPAATTATRWTRPTRPPASRWGSPSSQHSSRSRRVGSMH
jgi:hypothetical protein